MKKENFDDLLKKLNLTRKEFAEISGIRYTTVGKWNDDNRPIPAWVKSWLENYIEKKKFETVKQTLKDTGICEK
jgi:predicted transcriptional regulator